jgi:pilus assembly protein CpaF
MAVQPTIRKSDEETPLPRLRRPLRRLLDGPASNRAGGERWPEGLADTPPVQRPPLPEAGPAASGGFERQPLSRRFGLGTRRAAPEVPAPNPLAGAGLEPGGFDEPTARHAPEVEDADVLDDRDEEGSDEAPDGPPAPPLRPTLRAPSLRRADEPAPVSEPVEAFRRPDAVDRRTQRRSRVGSKENPQLEEAKSRLHEQLIKDLEHGALENLAPERRREAVIKAAKELIAEGELQVPGVSRDDLLEGVADEVLGLGPIEPLLRDPEVSEVMVNGPERIFYEKSGRIYRAPIRFRNDDHIMRIIERIVSPLGRRVDESSPMVDARLPDGSRVNITVPPASPKSPSVTIRKFQSDKMKMADLVRFGALSEATAEFLSMCVRSHLNIIISGGTGTGKTTMLNALSAFIPNTERIITIEDPTELQLQQEHVITLEARPPSIEGRNAVTQRDLVRNCLRMRPDRIIVGETRGSEAFDMLQAMNTGHDGSISTIHANTPRDAVARLENMVLMAGMELPARAIREQIASAIHLFVQLTRMQDGSRKITHVTEVSGMEGDTITLQDIFLFKLDHVDEDGKVHGDMRPTGIRPGFAAKFAMAGIDFPNHLFGSFEDW